MVISTQTLQSLNAAFKVQYADKLKNLVPEMAPILSKVPFVPANQKHGSVYIQPVVLTMDQGFTCHGPQDNIISLNNPVGHIIQQAQITACAYSGRSWISYGVLSRAAGSDQAFISETGHIVEALTKGFSHMVEGQHWYGQSGLGTTIAAGCTTASLVASSIGFSAANSAAYLWLGAEGMQVELYVAGSLILTTEVTGVRVNSSNGWLAGSSTEDGGITITLASVAGLADTNLVTVFRKGYAGIEHAGLKKILTTDSIFGIDGSRYGIWKANRHDANNAALSFSMLSLAVARSIGRGLTGPLDGYISPKAFRQLMPDYVSLGEMDASSTNPTYTSKGNAKSRRTGTETNLVHGTKDMKFIVDSVEVSLQSTEFVKGGDCLLVDKADIIRVGSTAPTFSLPGLSSQEYLTPRPDSAAAELRIYCDESVFLSQLNKSLIIQNVGV